MKDPEPLLPPLLASRPLPPGTKAAETAARAAATGEAGAGDLYWSADGYWLEMAVVLEPEVSAIRARQMLFVAMTAFGDSFGALAPPELGLYYRWPCSIVLNSGEIGHASIKMAAAADDTPPEWLVVGVSVRLARPPGLVEPGEDPGKTDLVEEGCGHLDVIRLIESWSRHLLGWIHTWSGEGFKPVHEAWVERMTGLAQGGTMEWQGQQITGRYLGLDEDGNLLVAASDGTRVLDLAPAIGGAERHG